MNEPGRGNASASGRRPGRRHRRAGMGALLWVALALTLAVAVAAGLALLRGQAINRDIDALAAGRDVDVDADAPVPALAARLRFLLDRDRLEEARVLVERIARRDTGRFAVAALYNSGNAQVRQALDLVERGRFDDAIAHVNLAKEHYMRALRLDPQHWDSKYNLDVAMRLVRDFPEHEAEGDEEGEPPRRLWTDLPGRPRGMP